MNSSITFSIYPSLHVYSFALSICISVLYISGVCLNVLLIVVVGAESRLHRPMYVLLVNLAVGGVMGSSSACPHVIKHLLADRQETSLAGCLTQVFFTNVYAGCIFCILALMAYDRYVSICKPLLYHCIMTPAKVKLMLSGVYVLLCSSSGVQVYLTSRVRLCRHTLDKLACDRVAIAHLSCEKSTVIGAFGLCCAACVIVLPCFLIILSYVRIFTVILRTSKECERNALQTCTPHFVTFINFSLATFIGVIYNRVSDEVPTAVNIFTFLNFSVIPPLLHPVIYGIKMQEIRQSINKMMKQNILQS